MDGLVPRGDGVVTEFWTVVVVVVVVVCEDIPSIFILSLIDRGLFWGVIDGREDGD